MKTMKLSSYLVISFALPAGTHVRDARASQPYAQQALETALGEFQVTNRYKHFLDAF